MHYLLSQNLFSMFADESVQKSSSCPPASELTCSVVHDTMKKIMMSKDRTSKISSMECILLSYLIIYNDIMSFTACYIQRTH